jgi:signal transduction histidine kinase
MAKTKRAAPKARTKAVSYDHTALTRAEARIKVLLERVVSVQDAERRRIALNIHDHFGQHLTALRMIVGSLKDHALSPTQLRQRIDRIDGIVAQLDKDLDVLAWDLRPASLDDRGLEGALSALLGQWSPTTSIAAEFHATLPGRLQREVESQLYRIAQEALNNVSKHSGASHVAVLLERRGDDVTLVIEDDGRGFDVERETQARQQHGGMGLLGMRERAALIGGRVQVETAPGKGTTVFVRVPITAATAAKA